MSADTFQIKRGTTAKVAAYVSAEGEPVYDTQLKQLRLGDGTTAGGIGVAPTASPTLTGTPTAPTAAPGTNTTQLATTAFVEAARVILSAVDDTKAPLESPALTGVPTAPTAAVGTNTTQVATTEAIVASMIGTVSQSGGIPTGSVIQQGTVTNGTFTKFADGTMIVNLRLTVTRTLGTAAGACFTAAVGESAQAYGQTFTVAPAEYISVKGVSSSAAVWFAGGTVNTTTTTGIGYILALSSQASTSYVISYTAIGRWF